MAAPRYIALLGRSCKKSLELSAKSNRVQQQREASWSNIFGRGKDKTVDNEAGDTEAAIRKLKKSDGPTTVSRLDSLKKKTGLISVRGYKPAPDVEEKVISIASDVLGEPADSSTSLEDRMLKFKVLTRLMTELDHPIPNTELSTISTLSDVITFFSTPVMDRSVYEDLSKLNLPRNLHIQMEPVRFDPDTDTFFDGQTAFPERPTVVSSLKYRRKYKGHSGESRNQRSITEFERQKELEEDRERLGWKMIPSEDLK